AAARPDAPVPSVRFARSLPRGARRERLQARRRRLPRPVIAQQALRRHPEYYGCGGEAGAAPAGFGGASPVCGGGGAPPPCCPGAGAVAGEAPWFVGPAGVGTAPG